MNLFRESWSEVPFTRKIDFIRRHAAVLLLFPLCCLLGTAALWLPLELWVASERESIRQEAAARTSSLARAYADQLLRTVQSIDQMLDFLKYEWIEAAAPINLQKQRARGLFGSDQVLHASIISADGRLLTTNSDLPLRTQYASQEFFSYHQQSLSDTLFISRYNFDDRTGRPLITFSRRLTHADGRFGGIALISVSPSYLASFYDKASLSENDFISARLVSGPLLATKIGQSAGAVQPIYRQDPVYRQASGVLEESGEKFIDLQDRIVAWQMIADYPLVALASLREDAVYGSFGKQQRQYYVTAWLVTGLLVALTAVAFLLSLRLLWERSERRALAEIFRLSVEKAREGYFMLRPVFDRNGQATDFLFEDCNDRGASMLGRTKATLVGAILSAIHSADDFEEAKKLFCHTLDTGYHEDEIRLPPGSKIQAEWIHRRIVRSDSRLALAVRDVSETKKHESELANLANTDRLTGLPNRHWFAHFMPVALDRARLANGCLALLLIDLDDFRNVNDTLGHAAGDLLILAIAARLKAAVLPTDHVIRLGGDEFLIVLEQVEETTAVQQMAKTLLATLDEPFDLIHGGKHRMRASIGISLYPHDGEDPSSLIKHADIAMYAAKTAGKNRLYFYRAELSEKLIRRIAKEDALRAAIHRDEFVIHYQPIVAAGTGRLSSMEALLRWQHPEYGTVYPLDFIQTAEDCRLILPIGLLVMQKVCMHLAQWREQGLPLVPVSINVSAIQLNEGNVAADLSSSMTRYDIEPSQIGIELTESCMLATDSTSSKQLDAIRATGVRLLIDDFGTGYSSLAQLQELQIDVLKIDRIFVKRLEEAEKSRIFLRAILSLAKSLNIGVIAEGVETEEQLAVLRQMEVDKIQGNFVSRPVDASAVPALLQTGDCQSVS